MSSNCFYVGVGAFFLPSTTTMSKRTSLSSFDDRRESREEEGHAKTAISESRREILGRAAGAFASTTLGVLSMPLPGFAASPSKVRLSWLPKIK